MYFRELTVKGKQLLYIRKFHFKNNSCGKFCDVKIFVGLVQSAKLL